MLAKVDLYPRSTYMTASRNMSFALTGSFDSFNAAAEKCAKIAEDYFAKRDASNLQAHKLSKAAELRRTAAIDKATKALENAMTQKADTATLRAEAKAYIIAVNFFKAAQWLPYGKQALKAFLAFVGKADVDVLNEMRKAAEADNAEADRLEAEVATLQAKATKDSNENLAKIAKTFEDDMVAATSASKEALDFQALAESFMETANFVTVK